MLGGGGAYYRGRPEWVCGLAGLMAGSNAFTTACVLGGGGSQPLRLGRTLGSGKVFPRRSIRRLRSAQPKSKGIPMNPKPHVGCSRTDSILCENYSQHFGPNPCDSQSSNTQDPPEGGVMAGQNGPNRGGGGLRLSNGLVHAALDHGATSIHNRHAKLSQHAMHTNQQHQGHTPP